MKKNLEKITNKKVFVNVSKILLILINEIIKFLWYRRKKTNENRAKCVTIRNKQCQKGMLREFYERQ